MRLCLLFILLNLAARAATPELPTSEQIRAWAGFPSGLSLGTRSLGANEWKDAGMFVAGVRYSSDKTRYSYSIRLFARDSFLRGRREEIFAMARKLQEMYREESGVFEDIGFHKTSKGVSFYIIPGGMGPGGGAAIAFASTKQFDVVVEQYHSDEGHPLDKTHEEGIVPSSSLTQVLEAVLAFLAGRAEVLP